MDVFARYLIEGAIIIPDAVFIFLPVMDCLRYGRLATFRATGVLLSAFLVAASCLWAANTWPVIPMLVAEVAFLFLLFFFSVKLSPGRKLFCFFNAVTMGAFCLLYSIAVAVPYEPENTLWASTRLLSLRAGAASLGLSLVVGLLFLRALYVEIPMLLKEDRLGGMWKFLFAVPLAALYLICWMTPIQPRILLIGRSRSFILVLLPLIPLVILLLYHMLWWVTAKFAEGARLQQENTFLQMEGKRYDALRRYMEDTRALRHNFKNHLIVINEYARSGETEKLLEYLCPLIETADGYVGYSSNRAVDAVASHYAARAAAQRTEVEWKIQIPSVIQVREADYCAMLGNLMDNALRAVAALPEERRKITVLSSMLSDSMLGLAVDNPYEGEITFGKNGLPVSAREGHGVGLASVLNTVHRYAGSMNIRTEGGVFSVEILLYPPKGKDGEKENRNRYPHGVFLI